MIIRYNMMIRFLIIPRNDTLVGCQFAGYDDFGRLTFY